MKRRQFITLTGGAAAWPLAARAQQSRKLPIIGFLGTTSQSAWSTWTAAFVRRLNEMGWIEGRTVSIEYRWAEGRTEQFAEIAAEFVKLKVDIILTSGSAGAAVKQAFMASARSGGHSRCRFSLRNRPVGRAPVRGAIVRR